MRSCLSMDPTSADPRKNADPCTSTLNFLLYEGLTRIRSNGEGELALAESVDVSKDGRTYTFRLRNARWSDGAPITAQDFEYSWKKILTPQFGSPCPYLLYPIKNAEEASQGLLSPEEVGIKAIDAKTLRVELEHPTPYFLSLITFCNFYPIPRHIELKNPSWQISPEKNLVVSGPFRLVKWERNGEIVLEKNLSYWDKKNVHLERISFSIVSNGQTALELFENGEIDFLSTLTTPISLEELGEKKKNGDLRVLPIGGAVFCTFNLERFPLNNVNIRKALSYAIDRNAIVKNITQLSETAATRCVPPIFKNYGNRPLFPAFDPKQALELFRKGMQELHTDEKAISRALTLSYQGEDPYRKIAQAIQDQWKTVLGIEAKLSESDRKTILTTHMQRKYSVGLDTFFAQYYDPYNILERFKHKKGPKNLPGFEHPTYVRLLEEACQINDPAQRLKTLDRAEEILMEEMPMSPIYHSTNGVLISPQYENVEFSPLGNLLFKNVTLKE